MNQGTVNLVIFIEQMATLLAKSIVDLKNVIGGSSTKTTEEIISDADATYRQIIENAKTPPEPPPAA